MYNLPKIFFIFFASMTFLSAQSRPDFDLRVENSFAKLYENPDVAIHAAKEIRNENHPLVVKDILAKAYLLKGDYVESVRTAFENLDLPNSDEHLLRNLMIAREFYHLNLYEQTSKITTPLLSEKKMSKIARNNDDLYAQLFQLQAKNYIALKQLNRAEKSLSKSSDFASKAGNATDLILKENELLTVAILSEKGHRKDAQQAADNLLNSLENLPRAVYLRSATEEILDKLEQFEESKNYLDNNMSLANLSAQLGTNTKYLSEIINKYKDKNFNTYINELRVKHVIQLLATDRSYLQYKISYIAEIGGFTSHSAFTNVFKTVTGMSPQEYMQTLRNS